MDEGENLKGYPDIVYRANSWGRGNISEEMVFLLEKNPHVIPHQKIRERFANI